MSWEAWGDPPDDYDCPRCEDTYSELQAIEKEFDDIIKKVEHLKRQIYIWMGLTLFFFLLAAFK